MMPPPPRRPRRWSAACTGTLVRLFVGVVLVALVAWPERHVPVIDVPTAYEPERLEATALRAATRDPSVRLVRGDVTLLAQNTASRIYSRPLLGSAVPTQAAAVEPTRVLKHRVLNQWVAILDDEHRWMYRDASLHVLLDIIRDVIDE